MENELQTSLSPLDYANLKIVISEEKATRAIIALLELQYQSAKNELKNAELAKEKVLQELRDSYQLKDKDQVGEGGVIIRGPVS